MAGIAWVNGRLLPPEAAAISPLDPGFMYGEGLFETMRAYQSRVFRLDRHLDRLLHGAHEIGLPTSDREELAKAVEEALRAGGLEEAAVRLAVTPGLRAAGTGDPALRPTVVVLVRELALPPREQYESGCRAVCMPAAHVASTALRRIKSLNYLDKLLAQRAAKDSGADEAILVDPDGGAIEGAMRNVFAVIGGRLITPPLSRGLLPGITRQAVLEVAERLRMDREERDFTRKQLLAAEECFLTSSLAGILPVASVDAQQMRAGAPGPLTAALTKGYRELVAEELGLLGPANRSG